MAFFARLYKDLRKKSNTALRLMLKRIKVKSTEEYVLFSVGDCQYKLVQFLCEAKAQKTGMLVQNGMRTQWVYNNHYICIECGIVVSFQD